MKSAIVFAALSIAAQGYSGAAIAAPGPVNRTNSDAPDNEKAPVPPIRYLSPFRDYRPLGEDERIPWKRTADEVGGVGDKRPLGRETGETPPSKSLVAPTGVREAGHSHHAQEKK